MKASEIIRETKRIDLVLAGRLEWALRYAAPMVDFNYQHYTSLKHAIFSGFSIKRDEQYEDYWRELIDRLISAPTDGSDPYIDSLRMICESNRQQATKRFLPKDRQITTPRMLLDELSKTSPELSLRIATEWQRYNDGGLDGVFFHLKLHHLIQRINWSRTIEGFDYWNQLCTKLIQEDDDLSESKKEIHNAAKQQPE